MKIDTHIDQFAECIRESKRPLGLFMGAGCPKSILDEDEVPLIPDTMGMTAEVATRVRECELEETWETVTKDVDKGEGDEFPNIEDVLSKVRGLRQYAGSMDGNILDTENLDALEEEICSGIIELVDVKLPSKDSGYTDIATWINSTDREEPIEIFTTNYDLLLEEALENERIPYFDGFVGGFQPFFDRYSVSNDELPPQWVRLWKIHGSMNWRSTTEDGALRTWRSGVSEGNVTSERAVIHPSHRKYDQSRKMPYLTLIDRLKEFLNRDESVLFVIGYSFGDEHLNDVLLQALRESPSSSIFAFMYSGLEDNEEAVCLGESHSNFCVFARDGCVVGSERETWETVSSEKEPELEKIGIKWKEEHEGEWRPEFTLGNFQNFGGFFKSATKNTSGSIYE